VDRVKQLVLKTIVGHDKSQMDIAMFKTCRQTQSAIFDKMYLDTGITGLVLPQKNREHILDDHRCRSHS